MRVAFSILAVALFAGAAHAQVNTICNRVGNSVYCNSTGSLGNPFSASIPSLGVLTPTQIQQQQAEADLARTRADLARLQLQQMQQAQRQEQVDTAATAREGAEWFMRRCAQIWAADTDIDRAGYAECLRLIPR